MNNNDILAVSNLIFCKSDFIEFEKAIRKRMVKAFFYIVITCVTIVFIAAAVSAILKKHIVSGELLILVVFCLLVSILAYVVLPRWLGAIRYKQYGMVHNSTGKIVFYLDRLETMVGEKTIQTLFYKDIKKIIQTSNLYVMNFVNKSNVIVRKDGFLEGCFEEVQNKIMLSNKNL